MWIIASLLLLVCLPPAMADTLRDPTMPGNYQASAGAASAKGSAVGMAELKSIIRSDQGHYAVIGGRVLTVGDRVGNARIKSIGSDYVSLSNGQTLRLFRAIKER